ncbi:hypothetical protein MRX96_015240 [Rhipicephalus microplus]
MTSRFTVSKTEKNLLADDASAERRYGSTGRGSASGYEDSDFHVAKLCEFSLVRHTWYKRDSTKKLQTESRAPK